MSIEQKLSDLREASRVRREKLRETIDLPKERKPLLPRTYATVPSRSSPPAEPSRFQILADEIHSRELHLREAIEEFEQPLQQAVAAADSDEALEALVKIRHDLRGVRIFADGRNLTDDWHQRIAFRVGQLQAEGFFTAIDPTFLNQAFCQITQLERNPTRYGSGTEVAVARRAELERSSEIAHRRLLEYLAECLTDGNTIDVVLLPVDFCIETFEGATFRKRVVAGHEIRSLNQLAIEHLKALRSK